MTNSEFIAYYTNLLIVQYSRLPKAKAHIEALINLIAVIELLDEVQDAYDIDTAVGVQLDVIGEFPIGLPRKAFIATDTDYRFYLKFKIILNNSNASLKEIDDLLYSFFGSSITYIDNQDMSMRYTFNVPPITITQVQFLKDNNLLPKPAGVGLEYLEAVPANPFVFYGDPDGEGYSYLMSDTLDIDGGDGIEKLSIDSGTGVEELFVFNYPGGLNNIDVDSGSGVTELLLNSGNGVTYFEISKTTVFGHQVNDGGEYSYLL